MFIKWYNRLLNLDHVAVIETYNNEIKDLTVRGHVRVEWGVRIYGPTRKILADLKCKDGPDAQAIVKDLETICIRKNYDGGMSG